MSAVAGNMSSSFSSMAMASYPNSGTGYTESFTLGGRQPYISYMMGLYRRVAITVTQNVQGAWIQVPTNLHIDEWRKLATNTYHHQIVDFLQFGYHVGFEGPPPSPSYTNHALAREHP